MAGVIPEQYLDLFAKKAVANLATLMPDGSPQVTPVWVDFDGVHIRINSARGRLKDKNMKRNPMIALALSDPENPFRYLEVRGRVVEITEEGASEHIDSLAKKYIDVDVYPGRAPGEVRVMYKIEPLRFSFMG
jgi:PPOX class probable F420-dependent enzyme